MDLGFLPSVNAALNASAGVLLVVGRRLAKQHRREAHRRVMLIAFALSTLFLAGYLLHKWSMGFENTPYPGDGLDRVVYLLILATHVPLAAAVPVLALRLIWLGTRGRIASHRRLARIAWPIWMYVSLSGVVIYFMLYRL
jgi:uncharacterized membrane protein YozB (DUF420 family)